MTGPDQIFFDQGPKTQTTDNNNLIIEYGTPEILRCLSEAARDQAEDAETDALDRHLSAYLYIALEQVFDRMCKLDATLAYDSI